MSRFNNDLKEGGSTHPNSCKDTACIILQSLQSSASTALWGPALELREQHPKVSQVHLDGLIISDIAQYGSSLATSLSPCLAFWSQNL
ncbi:unnamed protein product [Penicillium camemberti]|uniref:Str. FM013 n=1 Tax=Penicillium camemberti (strain FM 013) TaxID=1429867 RepID=A0A0G4PQL5_PENC3|nr:unnamed protein product [Penicillium camemberti]